MDSDSWSRLSSSASRRLQSRYDLYLGFEEAEGGEDDTSRIGGTEYNCPFCGEDFDFVGFCCHVDDEHAVEAKNGICPICSGRVGMDIVGHLTIQHANYFKMQRKRRTRNYKPASNSNSSASSLLSLLRKDLRDGSSALQSLLNGSGSALAGPDPFLSSLIYNLPVTDVSKEASDEQELNTKPKSSDEKPLERVESSPLSLLSEKDQKERAQKSEFVQGVVLSTILGDLL